MGFFASLAKVVIATFAILLSVSPLHTTMVLGRTALASIDCPPELHVVFVRSCTGVQRPFLFNLGLP